MLADELDYVVGVDPHRDTHALAIVQAARGAALFEVQVTASERGYVQALRLAERESPGRRAWAIEGTGSYGAGLARFLARRGERVLEVGRTRRERRSHAKTDALDALRAARSVLGKAQLASPRAAGEREALRALMVARAGALAAKKAGLCQLRAARHLPRAAAQRAALTDAGAAAPSAGGGAPGPTPGRRAARHAARAACARPPSAGAHRRGA